MTLRFTVEGLDFADQDAVAQIIDSLTRLGNSARIDESRPVFSAEIDPSRNDFADIRHAVSEAGRKMKRVLLAIVMSP